MASLKSVPLSDDIVNEERVMLQQKEFDKAHGQRGYYVILFHGCPLTHKRVDSSIMELYNEDYPGCVYSHEDITSEVYLNMVHLLISIYTGERVLPHLDTDDIVDLYFDLYFIQLKWLPIDIVEADAWGYVKSIDEEDMWKLDINHEKVELFKLKQKLGITE